MTPRQSNDATKSLSIRQFELAEDWMQHLRSEGGPMPVEMRRRFFELFWEEQLERELTGQPLRLPTGDSADETFLLGIVYAAADESLHVAPIVQPDLGDAGFDRGSASV